MSPADRLAGSDPGPAAELYRRLALTGARRALARLDRRPWSPTHGCFDREHWAYQTLLERPRPTLQQSVWGLALLWARPFPGNVFHRREETLAAVGSGLAFWARLRHRDGAVDEWYENERSFCATAFTTAAAAQALRLAGAALDPAVRRAVETAVAGSAAWLVARPGLAAERPANQVAAACLAATAAAALGGDPALARGAAGLRAALLARQHPDEGWFDEYGGPDLGYSLLVLDLLACLAELEDERETAPDPVPDPALRAAAARLAGFLAGLAGPDGTPGAPFGSRGTWHGFAWGAEAFALRGDPAAVRLAAGLRRALAADRLPTAATADDTYAGYFYLASHCLAATAGELAPAPPPAAAASGPSWHRLPAAGLVAWRRDDLQAVIDTRRGAWELRGPGGRLAGDRGFVALQAGGAESSEAYDGDSRCRVEEVEGALEVEVDKPFGQLSLELPLARWGTAFRLVARHLLRWRAAADAFARALRRRRVERERPGELRLRRRLTLGEAAIEIEDAIEPARARPVRLLAATARAGRHSPSADLAAEPGGEALAVPAEAEAELAAGRTAVLRRTVALPPR